MKITVLAGICIGALAFSATDASAGGAHAVVGKPAPAITAIDAYGRKVSLAAYKGKYVVVEWTNPECPFVRKHYDSGNMPATQRKVAGKDVVWLTVQTVASKPDDPQARAELRTWLGEKGAKPSAAIVDGDGAIGHAYGARTTPHMYIVDPQGTLRYAGAIDSKPSSNPADIPGATNYVVQAVSELRAGKPVSKPNTQAYGCSVKYPGTES